MGYESIAHEAEGRMGYWLRAYEITVLVESNYLVKNISRQNIFRKLKLDFNPFYRQNITNMAGAFRY